MNKKIVVLSGSPRKKGNTNIVVRWVVEGLNEVDAEVRSVDIAHLHYKAPGCIACMGCQESTTYQCVVQDDASPVVGSLTEYDGIVFATPVYFFGPSAQTKIILDRMFCLVKHDRQLNEFYHHLGGKTMGLIATAGGDIQTSLRPVEKMFGAIAGFLNMGFKSLLVPYTSPETDELEHNSQLQERAHQFGVSLVERT